MNTILSSEQFDNLIAGIVASDNVVKTAHQWKIGKDCYLVKSPEVAISILDSHESDEVVIIVENGRNDFDILTSCFGCAKQTDFIDARFILEGWLDQ